MLIETPSSTAEGICQQGPGLLNRYRIKRWATVGMASILFLLATGFLGFRLVVHILKERVVAALGPGSEIKELKVGWSSVELAGVRIQGAKGWPAARTLHADRVAVVPSLGTLLSDEIQIASINVENPYLSVLRVPGKLIILPSLVETGKHKKMNSGGHPPRAVVISRIVLRNGVLEIFDTTVSRPALKIRLEQIEAVVRDVAPVSLQNRTRFELTAVAQGKTRPGKVKVSGWVGAMAKDSSSHVVMENLDLVTLQPYIVKNGEARVSQGTLDLNLSSEVRNNRLEGVGKMIIRDLQFAPSQRYLDTFMGLPRGALIRFLKDHDNAIRVDFTLTGDIRHPNFSLNETLATRIAAGMAAQVGVSIQGVAEGLGALGRTGLEGASGTAGAVGSLFRGLFTGDENR